MCGWIQKDVVMKEENILSSNTVSIVKLFIEGIMDEFKFDGALAN